MYLRINLIFMKYYVGYYLAIERFDVIKNNTDV